MWSTIIIAHHAFHTLVVSIFASLPYPLDLRQLLDHVSSKILLFRDNSFIILLYALSLER